ncbi:hypothetical protein K3M35_25400 [Rhodococcus sp. DMU2021]|nr:hypothetical protein [Rhodococcus sp. DMU2021]PZN21819.1 MAG: hypothetical protein DIU75_09230 [Mycolicibacterium hassiacum]
MPQRPVELTSHSGGDHIGDATDASDPSTWFTAPPGQPDVEEYEHGFLAGFADYLDNAHPGRP